MSDAAEKRPEEYAEHKPGELIPVIELFGPTIQGEGLQTGTMTHFLRTGGCGLRCEWCDSLYAVMPEEIRKNRTPMTTHELQVAIQSMPYAPWINFTGGDPCIHAGLGDLINWLNVQMSMWVSVETQGMLFPEWLKQIDMITFSPKGPSSGNVVDPEPLIKWLIDNRYGVHRGQLQIKVVIFDEADWDYAIDLYNRIPINLYDAFFFTAGTPLVSTNPMTRTALVLESFQLVTQKLLHAAREREINFNSKTHVGCQQHVLLWPTEDKGV